MVGCFKLFSPNCWLSLGSCFSRLLANVLCFGGWFAVSLSFRLFLVAIFILCVWFGRLSQALLIYLLCLPIKK